MLVRVVRSLAVPLILGAVNEVVHLPELVLLARAGGGIRRIQRVAVPGEREVDETETDLPSVDVPGANLGLGELRILSAAGALEVAEFDQLQLGIRTAHHVPLRRD